MKQTNKEENNWNFQFKNKQKLALVPKKMFSKIIFCKSTSLTKKPELQKHRWKHLTVGYLGAFQLVQFWWVNCLILTLVLPPTLRQCSLTSQFLWLMLLKIIQVFFHWFHHYMVTLEVQFTQETLIHHRS